jgi:hypothetical protein
VRLPKGAIYTNILQDITERILNWGVKNVDSNLGSVINNLYVTEHLLAKFLQGPEMLKLYTTM